MFFPSVQNVEDTDLCRYFFWHITLICVLCQRTQIWGNIYFGGHRSEYDIRGHRSEEICFWKDIDLGVTSEDTYLKGHGFGKDMDLSMTWWLDTDPDLREGHGFEAVHRSESYIYTCICNVLTKYCIASFYLNVFINSYK